MEIYNKNRDNNQSLSDEIREQNAKLKGAPLKEKLLYFKDYYLLTSVIVIAICAFTFSLAYSIITAPKDTAFAAFFYNDYGDSSSTDLIDGFTEYMGIDTSKHSAYIDASMTYSSDFSDYDSYTGLEKAMAVITAQELDVVVGDAQTIDYYARCEFLHDVTDILPEDLLEQFVDSIFYAELDDGETIAAGIYVSDAPKLNENYYYYEDSGAILSFIVNSNNIDTAIEFLRFIYMED
ncbi:MAG: hypothetical protein LUE96_04080 [Lachnospiraceae bacterium]|nr:hypothetical protein [Lachnospiraceae bacterium]